MGGGGVGDAGLVVVVGDGRGTSFSEIMNPCQNLVYLSVYVMETRSKRLTEWTICIRRKAPDGVREGIRYWNAPKLKIRRGILLIHSIFFF